MVIVCRRCSFNVVIMIIACQIEYNKREPVSIYLSLSHLCILIIFHCRVILIDAW